MTKGEIAGLEGGSTALCGVAGVFVASSRARPTSAFILDKRAQHQRRSPCVGHAITTASDMDARDGSRAEREREREFLFEREPEHLWLRQLMHGIGERERERDKI